MSGPKQSVARVVKPVNVYSHVTCCIYNSICSGLKELRGSIRHRTMLGRPILQARGFFPVIGVIVCLRMPISHDLRKCQCLHTVDATHFARRAKIHQNDMIVFGEQHVLRLDIMMRNRRLGRVHHVHCSQHFRKDS